MSGPFAEKEVAMGNVELDKLYLSRGKGFYQAGSIGLVTGLDQSGQSDSNSEVSASESVGTNGIGDNENGSQKINVTFIDFLGLGAT